MKRILAAGTVLMLMTGSSAMLHADEFQLRSSQTPVRGDVTQMSKTEVTVKPRTGSARTIAANDIVSVTWEGEPPTLRLARNSERTENLQKAFDDYNTFVNEVRTGNPNLRADLEFLIARTAARLALTDDALLDDAIKRLEAFLQSNGENFRYYEAVSWLGRISLAKGDFDKAESTFQKLASAPWTSTKMAAKNATAQIRLAQGNPADAARLFDEVASMSAAAPDEKEQQFRALLGKATSLREQKQYEQAVTVLDSVIENASPDDASIQAEAFVRKGDCLQALGQTKEAILAYLHVDVLFPAERALRAEALFHLSRLWTAAGHPERSSDARLSLESDFPNSDWTRKLAGAG